jgi:hypothetical protein
MNDLDTCQVVRLVIEAVEQVIDGEQRRTGSVEGQRAAALIRRARVALDQQALQALREVG